LGDKREVVLHGARVARTFEQAAAHYVLTHQDKVSLNTEIILLQSAMPHIGQLALAQVHDGTLAPYVAERKQAGRKNKTINLALGVVRRILNLAATSWRDDDGRTWLETAPKITMLPLVGHQREPSPISWAQQRKLLPLLPDHLARWRCLRSTRACAMTSCAACAGNGRSRCPSWAARCSTCRASM